MPARCFINYCVASDHPIMQRSQLSRRKRTAFKRRDTFLKRANDEREKGGKG